MRKIIAAVLLLVGIGLGALAAYGYFFSEDQAHCNRLRSEAQAEMSQAQAAVGTPRETALLRSARATSELAEQACRTASQFYQTMMLAGLGGLALIIVSLVLLVMSRKRTG